MKQNTRGENIIRTDFNPSADSTVDELKQGFARLFNEVDGLRDPGERSERSRCVAIALTHLETAAMYAVKAATADA